jgi:dipicolinate synthase subunit B
MNLNGVRIGLAITGSFCTFEKVYKEIESLVNSGAKVTPIFSCNAANTDTRFGKAKEWVEKFETLTGSKSIMTIPEAEPVGPKNMFDILLIAPCTGNTIAKLAYAMTDTPVLMAAKSHIRNQKPVVIAISTNDGLGMNAKNLGILLNSKFYFFIPFGQDNPTEKKNSLVAKLEYTIPTIEQALEGKQLQPMIVEYR